MAGIVQGKVALVTGAAGGIGRAAAEIFAREGAKVVVSDLQEDNGQETVALIKKAGGEATFIRCDVSRAGDVESLVAKTVEQYGRLDCAYNNAGVEGEWTRLHECSEDNFDFNYRVNMKGVFLCIKYQVTQFLAQNSPGAIVSTASIAGLVGSKNAGAYVAAKHGILGLTKVVALEGAEFGVTCNAVCPGYVWTPLVEQQIDDQAKSHGITREDVIRNVMLARQPNKRFVTVEEIGTMVLFLCGPGGQSITGAALPIDGGWISQ
ncbi:MAG TPA: short chain dehydrogenase [Porticoccaceae bacterium]|nr:short chain dehydrogenase [Porticoccaceae bacterium]